MLQGFGRLIPNGRDEFSATPSLEYSKCPIYNIGMIVTFKHFIRSETQVA